MSSLRELLCAVSCIVTLLVGAASAQASGPNIPAINTIEDWDGVVRLIARADAATAQATADALYTALVEQKRVPLVLQDRVIFLYQGGARTWEVRGDFTNWQFGDAVVGTRIGKTDLWMAQTTLPIDSRAEYRFVVDGGAWSTDPANPVVKRPLGDNNLLTMPRFQSTDFSVPRPGMAPGTLSEDLSIDSPAMGYRINYRVYLPVGYDRLSRLPVLYVTDGNDWGDDEMGKMPHILDNLIGAGAIKPVLAVFIDAREPGNPDRRLANRRESEFLARGLDYARFLVDELVPLIDRTYKTDPSPAARVIQGTSYGGLFATFAGARYPDVFQKVAAFSPVFWALKHPEGTGAPEKAAGVRKMSETLEPVADCGADKQVECARPPLKIFMTAGIAGWDVDDLTDVTKRLEAQGLHALFIHTQQGHSWTHWASLTDEMLVYLIGAPPPARPQVSATGRSKFVLKNR